MCVAPACREIVRDGSSRCEIHKKQQKKVSTARRNEQRKEQSKENTFIYNTAAWSRLSKKKRTVDPFCEQCLEDGRYKQADVVDHIMELKDGGKPYEWSNLRSLCHGCHARKTADEKNKRKIDERKKTLRLF